MPQQNPVHQNADGYWYFWDETWAHEVGPFLTEQDCQMGHNLYVFALGG